MIDVTVCQTGMGRHAPSLAELLDGRARLTTVECFDRCDTCERVLIARVDGIMMRLHGPDDLVATLEALEGQG
jgi:hypothetical protein